MNINELENKSRELFENEKAAVNTDQLWSSIEDQLPQSKRKADYRKWTLLALLFIVFGAIGGYGIMSVVSDDGESVSAVILSEASDNTNLQEKANGQNQRAKSGETNEPSLGNTESGVIVENATTTGQRSDINSNVSLPLRNSHVDHSSSIISNISINKEKATSTGTTYKSKNRQIVINSEKGDNNDFHYSSSLSDLSSYSVVDDQSPFTSATYASRNAASTMSIPSLVNQPVLIKESEAYMFSNHALSTMDITSFILDSPLRDISMDESKQPFWLKKESKYFISLNAYTNLGHGQLTLENQDWTEHYNNRISAESSLPSYSFDIQMGYMISPNISINAGLASTSFFTRSSAEVTLTEDIMLDDVVVREIIGSTGTTEVRGTVQGQRITNSSVKRINKLSTVHVPLSLTWHQEIGPLETMLSVGGRYGISSTRSGYIHPTLGSEYDLSLDSEQWYTTSTPHFTTMGIGLGLPVTDALSLSLDFMYMHQINKTTSTTYGINEDQSNISIGSGIQIKF